MFYKSFVSTSRLRNSIPVIIALVLFAAFTHAFGVTLIWDANSETNIVGYRVYVGTQSRQYDTGLDVGLTTQTSLGALAAGQSYFFAVTAYDDKGLESEYSQEVRHVAGELTVATALTNVTVYAGQIATFATTVTGTGPFTFVWRKDGVVMEGMTHPMLSVITGGIADAGLYSLEVAGACNSVTNSAWLTVLVSDTNAVPVPLTITFSGPASPAAISFSVESGRQYTVQASPDLRSWQTIQTVVATTNGPSQWTDPEAPSHAMRFYRVLGSHP